MMARQMKDSGVEWIGIIPEDTKLIQLRFIADITTGNMDTQNREDDGEYPFYVRSPKVERSNQYSFDDIEAILMAGDGVGAGRVFHYVQGKYACHQRVYRMSNFKFVQSHFLKDYLEGLFPMIMDQGSAKSTVDSVRLPMLQEFKVVVFNKSEQQKIADFLDKKVGEIDSVIAKTKDTIEDYKKYKQAIITETVTKGLNPDVRMKKSGNVWIGSIPDHWKLTKIKAVSKKVTDGAHVSPETNDGVYDFISTVNLQNHLIDFEDCLKTSESSYQQLVKNGCKPKIDDVLISKDGTVGKTVVIDFDRDFVVASSLVIIRPNTELITPYYLDYNLQAKFIQEQLVMLMHGAGLKRVSVEKNANLPVLLPPLEEQKEIAAYLDAKCSEIDKLIVKKEELLTDLESYKKSLIYEYVTGKREI